MTLIERIAARLGFERPRPQMTELVVFASYEDAREAGFNGSRHRDHPHIAAWWPGQGIRGLAMRPFERVTIPHHMTHKIVPGEGRLVDILRARQRVFDRPVWIVL